MSEQQVLPEAEVTFADLGAALRAQAVGAAEQASRNLDLVDGIRRVGAENAALRASLAQSEAERERLREVVKEYRRHLAANGDVSVCAKCSELQGQADALLADKSKPVVTAEEQV